jgi:hypothetical protein
MAGISDSAIEQLYIERIPVLRTRIRVAVKAAQVASPRRVELQDRVHRCG